MEVGILEALFQGILQGLTEFLPVSSSGHLSLFQFITGSSGEGSLFFNLMLHLGTLAAVIASYYEDLWEMIKELGRIFAEIFTGKFRFKTNNPNRQMMYMLIVACLPMVLIIPLRGFVGGIAGDRDIVWEGVFFLVTSALLFLCCKTRQGKAGPLKMRPKHALAIGVMQGIATMPGISRSGATISTGLILGFDREFIVKFSFLLGIPAILGGSVFEIGDAVEQGINVEWWVLFVGMLAAAVVGYVCIRLVRWLVLSNRFIVFAWYTLILGIVVLIAGIVMHILGGSSADAQVSSSVAQSVASAVSLA